jgi:transcriptional regulator with XRE-family HTH domain
MNLVSCSDSVNSPLQNIFWQGDGRLAGTAAERLAQCRRVLSVILNRDINQAQMAELCGLSAGYWSHLETGHRGASRETIEKIVAALQAYGMTYVTPGWIDYGEGDGPPIIGIAPVEIKSKTRKGRKLETQAKRKKRK